MTYTEFKLFERRTLIEPLLRFEDSGDGTGLPNRQQYHREITVTPVPTKAEIAFTSEENFSRIPSNDECMNILLWKLARYGSFGQGDDANTLISCSGEHYFQDCAVTAPEYFLSLSTQGTAGA